MKMINVPSSVVMLEASKKDNELFETLKITSTDYENWTPKAESSVKRILGTPVYNFLEQYQIANKKNPAIKEYIEYKIINRRPKSLSRDIVKALDLMSNVKTALKEAVSPTKMRELDKIISACRSDELITVYEYIKKNIEKWSQAFKKSPQISKDSKGIKIVFKDVDVKNTKKVLRDKFNVNLKLFPNPPGMKGVDEYIGYLAVLGTDKKLQFEMGGFFVDNSHDTSSLYITVVDKSSRKK